MDPGGPPGGPGRVAPVKLDFYGLRVGADSRCEPDLEHELPTEEAVAQAKDGVPVLIKIWLRTEGPTDLEGIEQRLAAVLAPLGVK